MRLTTVFSAILLLIGAVGALNAADFTIDPAASAKLSFELQDQADFRVTDRGLQGLTVEITLPPAAQTLSRAGYSLSGEPSEMPLVTKWVVLPAGMRVTAKVNRLEASILNAAPSGQWLETDGSALVSFDNLEAPARVGKPVNFRGINMAPIMALPLQATEDAGMLIENRRLTVDLAFTPDPQASAFSSPKPLSPEMSRMLERVTANPPQRDQAANALSRMLVVYNEALGNQQAVMNDLRGWADWKRRMGYDVTLLGINVRNNQDAIKNAIRNYYEDENHGSLEFLVILGSDTLAEYIDDDSPFYFPQYRWDIEGNPVIPVIGDIYWATFDGDDYIPEVIVSRMPCRSAQDLSYALSRTRRYEQTPQGGDWLRRAVQQIDVVDNPYQLARSDLDITYWSNQRLREMGYADIDTVWGLSRPAIGEPTQDAYDEGASLGLSCGWNYGVVSYEGQTLEIESIAEVGRMHPFLISNATHYTQPIFADFFNAGSDEDENGLAAGYGFIEPLDGNPMVYHLIGWSVWAMRYMQEFTGGYLFQFGLLMFVPVEEFFVQDANPWEEMGQLHYYGDPTLVIRNAPPAALTAELPNSINAGATFLQFTVREGDNPAADATVCIMQPGGLHYVTHTEADGSVAFPIPEGIDPEEALLITAHKRNTLPLIEDVGVNQPRVNIVLEEGGFGGDEHFLNGESTSLELTLANIGQSDAENMIASFSSNSDFLTFSAENMEVQDIDAGEQGGLAEEVEMTLSPACPGGTTIQVRIDVASGNDHWLSSFEFITTGAELVVSEAQTRDLAPRAQGGLTITLLNLGESASDALRALLTTNTRGVEIIEGERSYAVIPAGQERAVNEEFTLDVNEEFIPGNLIDFEMNLTSVRGYEKTLYFSVGPVGEAVQADPLGPDGYGYACFDSDDNRQDWLLTPTHRWMEINPFIIAEEDNYQGSWVRFDNAPGDTLIERSNWDDHTVLPLPFPFTYYGVEYDSIVVCTNGWIALGSEERLNRTPVPWPLPGIGGPDAQIAPYAMDLKVMDPFFIGTGVFTYFNELEDLFVVEWSQVTVVNDSTNQILNFQIVLYDPEIYTTPTGDGEIAFQYKNAGPIPGPDPEYPYPLIGIRSPDGNDGLLYSWLNNEYRNHPLYGNAPAQAVEAHDELALLFTTWMQMEQGSAHGRVVSAENNQPVINAVIDPHRAAEVMSQDDGSFRFDNIRAGNYRAIITAPGFSDFELDFEVVAGEDVELPTAQLLRPAPRLSQNLYEYSLRPDSVASNRVRALACLENAGAGSLNYNVDVRFEDGTSPNFAIQQMFQMDDIAVNGQANRQIRGYAPVYAPELECYFIPNYHRGTRLRYISVVSKEGRQTGVIQEPIPQENTNIMRSLAWDGRHLWGGYQGLQEHPDSLADIIMVKFNLQGDSLFSFVTPFANINDLPVVYSPQRNSLFVTEMNEDIWEFDTTGAELRHFVFNTPGHVPMVSGLGWNPYDFDGMPLYVIDQWFPEGGEFSSVSIYKVNPESGESRLMRRIAFPQGELPRAAYGATVVLDYSSSRNALVTVQQYGAAGTPRDTMMVRELGLNLNFMVPNSFQAMDGVIPAGETRWFGFEADGRGRQHQTEARWSYYITHNGPEAPLLARVTLRFDTTSFADAEGGELPAEFGLRDVYPNPFNSAIRISFALGESQPLRIAAYDLQGRLAQELFNGLPETGLHEIIWDGTNLASGVYLIRMESATATHTRKVALVR